MKSPISLLSFLLGFIFLFSPKLVLAECFCDHVYLCENKKVYLVLPGNCNEKYLPGCEPGSCSKACAEHIYTCEHGCAKKKTPVAKGSRGHEICRKTPVPRSELKKENASELQMKEQVNRREEKISELSISHEKTNGSKSEGASKFKDGGISKPEVNPEPDSTQHLSCSSLSKSGASLWFVMLMVGIVFLSFRNKRIDRL